MWTYVQQLAEQAAVVWTLAERPDSYSGRAQGNQSDAAWWTNVAYWRANPTGPTKIPPGSNEWSESWKRVWRMVNARLADDSIVAGAAIWPVKQPPIRWGAGARFAAQRPWNKTQTRWHTGIDLKSVDGTPVLAPEAGVVLEGDSGWESSIVDGKKVPAVRALLLHLDSGDTVLLGGIRPGSGLAAGTVVQPGQEVAVVGRYPGGDQMLHVSRYRGHLTEAQIEARKQWKLGEAPPVGLLDPTSWLDAARQGRPYVQTAIMGGNDVNGEQDEGGEGE